MLEEELAAIFDKQWKWAQDAETSGRYPRSLVRDVMAAIGSATSAASRVAPLSERETYIQELVKALDEAHEAYRSEYEDEDGYGSATFHEIKRGVTDLAGGTR